MIEQVNDFKRRLEHDYSLVAENIPNFSEMYSLREFIENYKAIQSRMFGINRNDGTKIQAMVPVGDLFNHHNPPAIEWAWGSYDEMSGIMYTAVSDIPKDSPATYSYGSKSNY